MIRKTEAITLRVSSYSKTSQVVTWLTPDQGRVVTLAKGALRPKSHFLGQYDIFYTCEILLYHRERNAVHILRECTPLKNRFAFRNNWKAMLCASYICDIAARVSQDNHGQPELYELVDSSLDHLCTGKAVPQFIVWFELKLMKIMGMAPRLDSCQTCGSNLAASKANNAVFSPSRGSILCPACSGKFDRQGIPLAPDILAMLRNWQNSDSKIAAGNTRITEKQLVALRRIVDTFLDYHLDFVPFSRNIVMGLIQETAAARAGSTSSNT